MATTLKTLTKQQTELQTKLEQARKAKKSTKTFREQLAEVTAEVERLTAEVTTTKRPVGRPRKYSPEYYTLREASKRGNRRGRPNREQVTADLKAFGVEVSKDDSFRELEVKLAEVRTAALEAAK
jgi:hypothetical protein